LPPPSALKLTTSPPSRLTFLTLYCFRADALHFFYFLPPPSESLTSPIFRRLHLVYSLMIFCPISASPYCFPVAGSNTPNSASTSPHERGDSPSEDRTETMVSPALSVHSKKRTLPKIGDSLFSRTVPWKILGRSFAPPCNRVDQFFPSKRVVFIV